MEPYTLNIHMLHFQMRIFTHPRFFRIFNFQRTTRLRPGECTGTGPGTCAGGGGGALHTAYTHLTPPNAYIYTLEDFTDF